MTSMVQVLGSEANQPTYRGQWCKRNANFWVWRPLHSWIEQQWTTMDCSGKGKVVCENLPLPWGAVTVAKEQRGIFFNDAAYGKWLMVLYKPLADTPVTSVMKSTKPPKDSEAEKDVACNHKTTQAMSGNMPAAVVCPPQWERQAQLAQLLKSPHWLYSTRPVKRKLRRLVIYQPHL